MDACLGLYDEYYDTYVMLSMIEDDSTYLPRKVDLRDFDGKNYVTPVKFQNPFGTCWAFALASVAEECYLFDNDLGVPAGEENKQINLSEKYLAWYMYRHITELEGEQGDGYLASQVGEGCYADDLAMEYMNSLYDMGGFPERAANLLMAGFGLMNEDVEVNGTAPYAYGGVNRWRNNDISEGEERAAMRREFYYLRNKYSIDELIEEGKINSADEFEEWFEENWVEGKKLYDRTFKYPCYSPVDDWSIPDGAAYRQTEMSLFPKEIKLLDSPAHYGEDGYEFSEEGLFSIKNEIANGHAVGITIFADRSQPDDDDLKEDCIINFDHWAQYYSGEYNTNHAVTIIGYDDNYPKEYFTFVTDGAYQIMNIDDAGKIYRYPESRGFNCLGDLEFATGEYSPYLIEIVRTSYFVSIPLRNAEEKLRNDPKFLSYIIQNLGRKLQRSQKEMLENQSGSERVLAYMENVCTNGILKGTEKSAVALRMSRRQLQRILKQQCDKGIIKKTGRGTYRLREE